MPLRGESAVSDAELLFVAVADTVDGFDYLGILRVVAYFFAKFRDVLVKGSTVWKIVHSPALVKYLIAADDVSLLLTEEAEHTDIS